MKPRLLAAIAAVFVALVAVWFFALRKPDDKPAAKPTVSAGTGTGSGSARPGPALQRTASRQ